eukprot:4443983-Pleurochrysis_carterae.AAC.2
MEERFADSDCSTKGTAALASAGDKFDEGSHQCKRAQTTLSSQLTRAKAQPYAFADGSPICAPSAAPIVTIRELIAARHYS